MGKKILLIGGGGHCTSVLDTLYNIMDYSEVGIIDKKENIGKRVLDTPIIGSDDDLAMFHNQGYTEAFVTVGSIGDTNIRTQLFQLLEKIGFIIPNIIDPTAIVSVHASLNQGIFVGKNAVINAGSFIHKGAIINTSSIVEHDCVVEEFSHIAPGAVLCGQVYIGANSHIGANSVIKQQVKIGPKTMIGMGSVVLQNMGEGIIAYGNPCKEAQAK